MYLELTGTTKREYSNPGSSSITDVEIEIGGQKIDKHTGHWMEVWNQLTEPNPVGRRGVTNIAATVGKDGTLFQNMSGSGGVQSEDDSESAATKLFVPLQFWFCRNPGLALPLIALQYHEVKVILNHVVGTSITGSPTNKLWCDYIYLDTDERRRFAQVSHEYLIEQVQEQSWTTTSTDLNFNHPVKELIFSEKVGFVYDGVNPVLANEIGGTAQLKLNGHDRFASRDYRYFTRTQVWAHHSGAGGLNCVAAPTAAGANGKFSDGIGVYSFALKPEEHQPSGTCNFSRIDNAQLTGMTNVDTIHAVNYNVLRIMSGMGGLAYSN